LCNAQPIDPHLWSFRLKSAKSLLVRTSIAAAATMLFGSAYALDTGLTCQAIGIWDAPPATNYGFVQGTDVAVKIGIAGNYGGVGVLFSLNGVNILESRAATGGGWQTSSVIWDGPAAGPHQHILFNQGAGNSRVGQWGYHNSYAGLTAQDFNPIWSDNIHPASDHTLNDQTSPCPTPAPKGYLFDHGKLNIGMATGATPGHGNLVLLTNEYTYQHQVNQAWPSWYAEQAFYLDKKIARSNNLRVYVTDVNNVKSQIDPFNGLATQSTPYLSGIDFPNIKYAILVWKIDGKDIGVAIDGRRQATLGTRQSFHGSLMRQDNNFSCMTGEDHCGVFEWHTYMQEHRPATLAVGTPTKVSTDYRVGTLQQLAAWGYTIGTAPVCSSLTLTPSSLPASGGQASAQANCTGSGASYAWTVNGAPYAGNTASISATLGANASGAAQSYAVCATASNAGGSSQPVCATLTQAAALPAAPVCSSLTLTPNNLPSSGGFVSGQANCTGSGLSYAWKIDGTAFPGNASSNATTVVANTNILPRTYWACVTASNAGGQSQACAPLTQAAQVPSGPVALVRAESNNVLWPASSLIDGNIYSTYSSNVFPSSANSSGTYVAAWTSGSNVVQSIRLYARTSGGQMLGFPASYNIYLTSADNSQWISMGTFSQQPNGSGVATINLSSPTTTWGIQIVPTSIGTDNVGNYVFQLNEIELVR
jgi:hypothetical protein